MKEPADNPIPYPIMKSKYAFSMNRVAFTTITEAACTLLLLDLTAGAGVIESQMLRDHVPPAVATLHSIGPLPASQRLDLAIGLPLRNQDSLSNLLHQIYDPASTNFHRYLTPERFTEMFGTTEQ